MSGACDYTLTSRQAWFLSGMVVLTKRISAMSASGNVDLLHGMASCARAALHAASTDSALFPSLPTLRRPHDCSGVSVSGNSATTDFAAISPWNRTRSS